MEFFEVLVDEFFSTLLYIDTDWYIIYYISFKIF